MLFTVYAPPGIAEEGVRQHLQDIRVTVSMVSLDARTEVLETVDAG